MARSADGRYFVAADPGAGQTEWVFEIDPFTGASTALFDTGIEDIRSMAFAPDGTLERWQRGYLRDILPSERARPTGVDEIEGRVASVDRAPVSAGKFDVSIEITGDTPDWLLPGMTAKAKIVTYEKKKAVLVPEAAVHTDEDEDKQYVWVVEEEDDQTEVQKQWVKTGKSKDKQVEITSGLKKGDVISLDPKEQGTDDDDDEEDDDD